MPTYPTILSQTEIIQPDSCFIDVETKISSPFVYQQDFIVGIDSGMTFDEIQTEINNNPDISSVEVSGSVEILVFPKYNMYFRPSELSSFNHQYVGDAEFNIIDSGSTVSGSVGVDINLNKTINRTDRNTSTSSQFDMTIDWGDSNIETYQTRMYISESLPISIQHTYSSTGSFVIGVSGDVVDSNEVLINL